MQTLKVLFLQDLQDLVQDPVLQEKCLYIIFAYFLQDSIYCVVTNHKVASCILTITKKIKNLKWK